VALENIANSCFVCGPANSSGLKVRFRMQEEVCRAEFTPGTQHMGYDEVTHGGILFSLLDDVMANWLWLQGQACFTAKADIRYREQVMVGTPIVLEGRLVKRKGPLALMQGKILRAADGVLLVEASASFMLKEAK
jgi:acyl-coenzyme A thioesterase PaaI-like protein